MTTQGIAHCPNCGGADTPTHTARFAANDCLRCARCGETTPRVMWFPVVSMKPRCDMAPIGCRCTRELGHEGPCAAVVAEPPPENCFACTRKFTLRERIGMKLFPSRHCEVPEEEMPVKSRNWQDVLVIRTSVVLSWADWLRVVFSGRINVETKTATERVLGCTKTSSVAYAAPPPFLDTKE